MTWMQSLNTRTTLLELLLLGIKHVLRKTIVTLSIDHIFSEYKSLKGMRKNYGYLIQPNSHWIYFRRYTCTTCFKCKDLDFLNCVNPSRGAWKKTKIEFK